MLFIFFKGLCGIGTLFIKRQQLSILLTEMDKHFWTIDDVELTLSERISFTSTHQRLKTICLCSWISSFILTSAILLSPFVFVMELPFAAYQPAFLGFGGVFILEIISASFGNVIPVLATNTLVFNSVKLTELQFGLLNRYIENSFKGNSERDMKTEIKRIAVHHSFLLRYNFFPKPNLSLFLTYQYLGYRVSKISCRMHL